MILEEYSVLISDKDRKKQGTGTLFYQENSDYFYVFTCAHVLDYLDEIHIRILADPRGEASEEWEVTVPAEHVAYSPIDEVEIIGSREKKHSCDIAVIACEKGALPLQPAEFMFYPMNEQEKVRALGYPGAFDPEESLYYQQDKLKGQIEKYQMKGNHFVIRVEDSFLNQADRVAELKGFSGSPVWDDDSCGDGIFLYGGLIAYTNDGNASRARVNVMKGRLIQSLMKENYGIQTENYLPGIPKEDIAPGCEPSGDAEIAPGCDLSEDAEKSRMDEMAQMFRETEHREALSTDLCAVLDSWITHEIKKIITYIDGLQMESAMDTALKAIANQEFEKCGEDQRLSVYRRLLECHRACREFDAYDEVLNRMHEAGSCDREEDFHLAVRYLEEGQYQLADRHIEKALELNPSGKLEKVFKLTIRAMKDEGCQASVVNPVLGSSDQLLFTSCSQEEEEGIYQVLGYVLGMRFHQWGRAVRCLNRAYKISGNLMILETLATTYYFYSMRDAYIEEGSDRVDPLKINAEDLYKARGAYLRILSSADEKYKAGLIKRTGLQMFKCFVFLKDNYRIYRHYQDMMQYYEFHDPEQLRMTQIDYLYVAIKRGPQDISSFQGLTETDKKYFETVTVLEKWMRIFDTGSIEEEESTERNLLSAASCGESMLRELEKEEQDGKVWNLNKKNIRIGLINIYGNGILRYRWNAIDTVKSHYQALEKEGADKRELESLEIYLFELESGDFQASEQRYREFFEKHGDVISYNEWIHFYTRNNRRDKSKELYERAFDERNYLISAQPEYFYRAYIMFIIDNQFDLKYALECYVNHEAQMEDGMVRMLLELELQFDTCCFNEPDRMLDTIQLLYQEGLMLKEDYRYKTLIVNMMSRRFKEAEKYVVFEHFKNPELLTNGERSFYICCMGIAETNPHWNPMAGWNLKYILKKYEQEQWRRDPADVMAEYSAGERKAVAVDLWALYIMARQRKLGIMGDFSQVYITHMTFSHCLQELCNINDPVMRALLMVFIDADNIVWRSPTIEEQLPVRNETETYLEFHHALTVGDTMDCPVILGEHRYPVPERFWARIIRPCELTCI